jgi:hypothetical protein
MPTNLQKVPAIRDWLNANNSAEFPVPDSITWLFI